MKLAGFLERELTSARIELAEKKALLDHLLGIAHKKYPLGDRAKTLKDLVIREQQSSTGIGCGVAIPHAIVDGLAKTILILGTVPDGIEFHAIDKEPVRVIFLLLSPPGRVREHIKLLARIARICSTESIIDQLASAHSPDEIVTIVENQDKDHIG